VLRKIKYTWERGAGIGWVVAASSSIIYLELHYNCFNYYVMARTSLLFWNKHKPLHHPLEVSFKEEQVYLREGCGSWLGCCSLFSVIYPELHYNCFNYYVMARTSLSSENSHKPFHHPLEVCIKEEQAYLGEGCWSWLGRCSLFSVICQDFHYNCFNYYVMARTSRSLGN
jgi:hypothetical protein